MEEGEPWPPKYTEGPVSTGWCARRAGARTVAGEPCVLRQPQRPEVICALVTIQDRDPARLGPFPEPSLSFPPGSTCLALHAPVGSSCSGPGHSESSCSLSFLAPTGPPSWCRDEGSGRYQDSAWRPEAGSRPTRTTGLWPAWGSSISETTGVFRDRVHGPGQDPCT